MIGGAGVQVCLNADAGSPGLTSGHWIGVDRAIRTGQLRALPRFHIRPINVMVFHGPRGELV